MSSGFLPRNRHVASHLVNDKRCVESGKFQPLFFSHHVHDEIEDLIAQGHIVPFALRLKDQAILIEAWRPDLDLVRDPAQEGGIDQVFRFQIGGKDHQLFKGYGEAGARMQLQIVDPALHRHDPAVQRSARSHKLPAEVVDEETAAKRLHVQRSFIIMAYRVVAHVEHIQRQLAACDHERPSARNPALVVRFAPETRDLFVLLAAVQGAERKMNARVIKADDLALDDRWRRARRSNRGTRWRNALLLKTCRFPAVRRATSTGPNPKPARSAR